MGSQLGPAHYIRHHGGHTGGCFLLHVDTHHSNNNNHPGSRLSARQPSLGPIAWTGIDRLVDLHHCLAGASWLSQRARSQSSQSGEEGYMSASLPLPTLCLHFIVFFFKIVQVMPACR